MRLKLPDWWTRLNEAADRVYMAGLPTFLRAVGALALAVCLVATLYLGAVIVLAPGAAPFDTSFPRIFVLFPYYLLVALGGAVQVALLPALAMVTLHVATRGRLGWMAFAALSACAFAAFAALVIFAGLSDTIPPRLADTAPAGRWGVVAMAGLLGALFTVILIWLERRRSPSPCPSPASPSPPSSPSR